MRHQLIHHEKTTYDVDMELAALFIAVKQEYERNGVPTVLDVVVPLPEDVTEEQLIELFEWIGPLDGGTLELFSGNDYDMGLNLEVEED